jgi:peptide/nickel transport system permease protein
MILPWCTLGLALLAAQTATMRAGLVDALHQEYIVMAESRGLRWRHVVRRHAVRSALVPVITLLGLQLSYMIVGSVFVDFIFGLGGLGSVLVTSVNSRDLTVVQASVMCVSVFFVLANLVVDLVARRLDPRYELR